MLKTAMECLLRVAEVEKRDMNNAELNHDLQQLTTQCPELPQISEIFATAHGRMLINKAKKAMQQRAIDEGLEKEIDDVIDLTRRHKVVFRHPSNVGDAEGLLVDALFAAKSLSKVRQRMESVFSKVSDVALQSERWCRKKEAMVEMLDESKNALLNGVLTSFWVALMEPLSYVRDLCSGKAKKSEQTRILELCSSRMWALVFKDPV